MNNTFFPKNRRPFLISGPCSVETESQLLETSHRLCETGKIDLLRGGIWKPRTRPNSFEGVGEVGLPWLIRAKQETGLPVTTEVAKATHVELCLKHGIDVLWIGARTTVNPFAVQEIADALRGVNIPVMIKNPINPDVGLWLGAVERLQKAGLHQIAAIHRGFSHSGEKYYRNRPQWQYAIDFKQEMPDLPMVNDPSHICGRRDILQEVAQKAMDLNMDGLMIESHITPNDAWSDAAQQITPEVYAELVNSLVLRSYDPSHMPDNTQLDKLRGQINLIDEELISMLSSRMAVAREIGNYKKEHNITILQADRWHEILSKFQEMAQVHELSEEFITHFIKAVHDESINQQERVINKRQ